MKTSNLMLFSCLLLTISANFFPGSAQNNLSSPVLDTAGQELRRGADYYILPAERGNGGGITLENDRGARCPYRIAQIQLEGNNGLPLGFSSINPNDAVIRVNTDLNIRFTSGPTTCPESNVWTLNTDNQPGPLIFVTVGGVEGNPGRETLPNWFRIQTYEDAYQLEYCPGPELCGDDPCRLLCGNIGIVPIGGLRRLAINQPIFKIVFQRA